MLGKRLGTKQMGYGAQKEQGIKLARQKMADWACFLPRGSEGPALLSLGDGHPVSSKCLANYFSSFISSHPPATHLLQETGSCSGTPLPSTSPWDLVG